MAAVMYIRLLEQHSGNRVQYLRHIMYLTITVSGTIQYLSALLRNTEFIFAESRRYVLSMETIDAVHVRDYG